MRRLPIRTDLEGPKAAEIALHARSDVFSPSGSPLLERVFLFTVVRRNRAAKYGREIWRGRRTCSRATMRSHPLLPSPPLHDPSPFDRPTTTTPTSTHTSSHLLGRRHRRCPSSRFHTTFFLVLLVSALKQREISFRGGERGSDGGSRVSGIPSAIIRPHSLTHSTPAAADDFMLASSTHQVLLRACGSGQGQ